VPNIINDQILSNQQQLLYPDVRHWEELIDYIEQNWLSEDTIPSDYDIQMQRNTESIVRRAYGIFPTWANDE